MARYAALVRPSANRVFGGDAGALMRAELEVVDRQLLGGKVERAAIEVLGGVEYLGLDCASPRDLCVLSNLSSLYALFERAGGSLRPVGVTPRARYDDDLLTTQRYAGKTNEAFTKLLLNVTLACNPDAVERLCRGERPRLLDPVCGRGTSLNQALTYGLDAFGIEIEKKDFEAYRTFLTTWLTDHGIGHKVENATLRRGRESVARTVRLTIGGEQVMEMIHDDTTSAPDHLAKGSVDVVVADLPYGVQHGAKAGVTRRRRPDQLVVEALPAWLSVLRRGGAVGLSWNVRTLDRRSLCSLVEGAGYELRCDPEDRSFEHRVDRTITRDVLLAVRP